MRTYSFDHFKADKPEPSTTNPGGAEQTPPVEQARPHTDEGLHYGRQHAQTAELYRKHREERERAEQMRVSEAPTESKAAPRETLESRAAEPPRQDAEQPRAEQSQALEPDEAGQAGLKDLAQQAVSSVLEAAKEAAKGRPISGARKLAGEALSGVRRVAQEVSARTGRSVKKAQEKVQEKEQEGGTKKKKGPSKKR